MATIRDMIKERPMSLVQGRMQEKWVPRRSTHILIIAESGGGKTGLIRDSVMPLCSNDRVLWIDVKADTDAMLRSFGTPLGPDDVLEAFSGDMGHYRLVVDPIAHPEQSKRAVKQALELALEIGNIVVVCDEVRSLTESGQLGLHIPYEQLLTKGRSNGVSVVSALAATDNVYASVRNQWSFAFVGSLNGTPVIDSALKMLGLDHRIGPKDARNPYPQILSNLRQFEFLYLDKYGGGDGKRYCLARVKSFDPETEK